MSLRLMIIFYGSPVLLKRNPPFNFAERRQIHALVGTEREIRHADGGRARPQALHFRSRQWWRLFAGRTPFGDLDTHTFKKTIRTDAPSRPCLK
jgi:hypothetical protein